MNVDIKNEEMIPTKRAVIDIGRLCNLKCKICYYRYETFDAPEGKRQTWMKNFEQLKKEVLAAIQRGCDSADVTGGEPTIHKDMVRLAEFCKERNFSLRIITNGQASDEMMYQLVGAGVTDWLFSTHHLKDEYEDMTQVKGSWGKLEKNIKLVEERGCRYAFNFVIYNKNYSKLPEIAEWMITQNPYQVNGINCNPQYETDVDKHKNISAQIKDIKEPLQTAIDILTLKNIWVNIRYLPHCALDEEYRKYIVNHSAVMFDEMEWDYGAYPKTMQHYLKYGREAFQYKSDNQTQGKCGKCHGRDICSGCNNAYYNTYGDEEFDPESMPNDKYPFYYRNEMKEVDIVIPVYKVGNNLNKLLLEIIEKTRPPYNIVLLHGERSASRNRNKGKLMAQSPYVIMVDDDIGELPYEWNLKLINKLHFNPKIMAVSARLYDNDGSIGPNTANNINVKDDVVEVDMIPTACCCFRNYDATGIFFNEDMIKSGWEDTLFFEELKKYCEDKGLGTKIVIANDCKVVHLHTAIGYDENFIYNKQVHDKTMETYK